MGRSSRLGTALLLVLTVLPAVGAGPVDGPTAGGERTAPCRHGNESRSAGLCRATSASSTGSLLGWRQVGRDAGFLVRRPFRLERRGRRKALAIAGATALLYAGREEIREFVLERRSDDRTRLYRSARTMGKGAFAPSLALIAWMSSFATDEAREKETAALLLESMAFSAAAAYVGSFTLAAERPEDGDSIRVFDTDGRGVSLDAALAASVVPVLRCQYLRADAGDSRARRLWKRAATGGLYAGAALTGYQRMDADEHWAPDVFLGLMAGLQVGSTLCRSHEATRRSRIEIALMPGGAGLAWTWRPGARDRTLSP